MRTSKKLLSFFLAVVMVFTTCSVGFTAYAQDNRNSIWQTNCDANAAFTTLNGLADELPKLLMGIDLISKPIYQKYAKAEGKSAADLTDAEKEAIADKATLQDVLGGLQPMLIGVFHGESQGDFLNWFGNKYPIYRNATSNPSGFDYLNDNGDNSLSYYQIVTLCDKFRGLDNTGTLAKWYDDLIELAKLYPELYNASASRDALMEDIAEQIRGQVTLQPGGSTDPSDYSYYNATLYDLKNFNFDFGEAGTIVDEVIADYNAECKAINNPYIANDFAEYVYYAMGAGQYLSTRYAVDYMRAIATAGKDVIYKGSADIYGVGETTYTLSGITLDNYNDKLTDYTLAANGFTNALDYLDPVPDYTDEINDLKAERNEKVTAYAAYADNYANGKDGDATGYEAQLQEIVDYYYAQAAAAKATFDVDFAAATTNLKKNQARNKYNTAIKNLNVEVFNPSSSGPGSSNVETNPTGEFDTYVNGGTLYQLSNSSRIGTLNNKYKNEIAYVKNYPAYPAAGSLKPISVYDSEIDTLQAKQDAASSGARSFTEEYARSYMQMKNDNFIVDTILYTNSDRIANSEYYQSILNGLAILNSNASSVADVDKLAAAKMPESSPFCQMTDEEIRDFGETLNKTIGYLTSDFWIDGKQVMTEGLAAGETVYLPASLKNTAVARYFYLVDGNKSSETNAHRLGLYSAFYNNNKLAIAEYYEEAYAYARSEAVKDVLVSTGYVSDIPYVISSSRLTDALGLDTFFEGRNNALIAALGTAEKVVLTPEQEAILKADYTTGLTDKLGADIVNTMLNDTVVGLLTNPDKNPLGGGQSLEELLVGLFITPINIKDIITDVWMNLYNSPVETIVNILPALVVLVDEIVLPFVVNGEGNQYNGLLTDIVTNLLGSYDNGSYLGMATFNFDLNKILPNVMHWLMGDLSYPGITYWNDGVDKTVPYKVKDSEGDFYPAVYKNTEVPADLFDHYVVKDAQGNEIVRNGEKDAYTYTYMGKTEADLKTLLADADTTFGASYTYEGSVPYITGIYIADKALRGAEVADLGKIFTKLTNNESIGAILGEVVTELATLFTASIDEFLADDSLAKAPKYDVQGNVVGRGLNNVFVALPQLFDIMENLAADKYGVDKNAWTYCYDGKITTVSGDKFTDMVVNSDLETFKAFAAKPNPVDIFDCFAGIFVENWLNAILSLVNNVVATDNEISSNLPIVAGLLNALGGFGEDSILTDVINGVFQIEREYDYSFTLEKRANGFTGLSKDNAYFLITNITTLIDVVKNLIGNIKGGASINGNGLIKADKKAAATAPTIKNAKANSKTYTTKELSNTTDLINNLDKMLSSLLSDSTLNGFSLDSTNNILAGLITTVSNYLGRDCYTKLVRLVNQYVYYITEKDTHTPNSDKDVDPKKVYTNKSMTGLMVETFLLIEDVVETLFSDFGNDYTLANGKTANYNLIVEAVEGLISPDAICVRLDGYDKVAKELTKYNCWHNAAATTSRGNYKISLDWGIEAGDKEAFFNAFASSLRLITSILGVVLVDTGWYGTVVMPILNALCKPNGVKVDTAAEFAKLTNGYHDEALLGLMAPVAGWLDKLLASPATTLIKSVQGIAGILDDKHGATIASIVKGGITPIVGEVNGLASIFGITSDKLIATSPTLQVVLENIADKLNVYSDASNIKIRTISLSGENLIPILNRILTDTGISLKQISWYKLSTAKSPAAALVYVLDYLLETILDNKNLTAIAKLINNDVVTLVIDALKAGKITSTDLLGLLNKVLEITDTPTLVYWTFAQYLQELTEKFVYPKGITKQMADNGVKQLDAAIGSVLSLLGSLGVDLGADDLQGIISKNLFTNKLLTTIATALYGALDGLDPTVKTLLSSLGIVTSTKDVAKILTDKSYGKTFTSAANAIKAKSSWKDIKTINWGFKDGSAKAQQGFVNALAAILRPVSGVLEVFLNEGTLELNNLIYDLVTSINIKKTTKTLEIAKGDTPITAVITYSMKNGVLKLKFKESTANRANSKATTAVIDFRSLGKTLKDVKIEGTNGYNSAIIPLLEALGCTNLKSYSQYQKDAAKAKDNILLNILNPLVGDTSTSFLNKLCANPVSELTKLLPNLAMYLDAHGVSQLLSNLLAPVTQLIYSAADTLKLDKLIKDLVGMPLGDLIGALLGLDEGQLNIKLSDLTTLNIEDLIIPIVNMVFKGLDNKNLAALELKDIDWNALISLGTKSTYKSKATGADGKYLTGKIVTNVDQGKVLIAVLRYVADTLVSNATPIKNLICGIDAIKKNDMISSIVKSVFNTLGTASPDQIVAAVFYLLAGEPTNAFWDYTAYKTGQYSFSYPEGVDVDFLKNLPPMLDGLIGGLLDLNETIGKALFKDELISKLAKGLYGAVEGVKVGDGTLTALLAQTDIDFSTANVANLLTDKAYGKTFDSAAAVIRSAGSWANVNIDSLKWGVTDRDSFFHALVAVLRPIYGVLDVLLNDASLGIFNIVRIPGSNGYTSSIVPLLEAFSCYNVKTQYQYRQDITKEYDAILLDIINPIWDKVEDLLAAPIQTVAAMVPNLALFIGNDGLCQIIDNLLTPVSALLDAVRPVVDLNDLVNALLPALGVDLGSLLGKIGITNFKLDLYDLNKTLKPVLGGDSIISLVNNVLGLIKIKGTPLGIKLNPVDWLQLASHGKTVVSYSQAATYGARIFVQGDSSETLIAVLKYLIVTINTGDNFKNISDLIGGLIGGADDSISGTINDVLSMLTGDTDQVIADLVGLLQTLA